VRQFLVVANKCDLIQYSSKVLAATQATTRQILHASLLVSTIALLALGTLTIYAFDPCPAGTPAELLPSFCAEVM
jgi:hypothetical protein